MSDYILTDSDELRHYGVIGMKWGIRRAKKKGTTYQYKSHSTKKYERKADKAWKKAMKYDDMESTTTGKKQGKAAEKYVKAMNKYDKMTRRAKRSAEFDAKMQKMAKNESTGKTVAKTLLVGTLGNTTYTRLKSAGVSKGAARVATVLSTALGGVGGNYATGLAAKSVYIRKGERKKR